MSHEAKNMSMGGSVEDYTPLAFDERVTFLTSKCPVTALCVCVNLLHCMHVRLRNGYMQADTQVTQH